MLVLVLGYLAFRFTTMDAKLARVYYGPQGYRKGIAIVRKLAGASKVFDDAAKQ